MSQCKRATDIYIFAMLFAFPLFAGFQGYAQITASKFFFLLTVTILWIVSLIVFSVRDGGTLRPVLPMHPTELAAILFAAICIASALFSPWLPATLLGAGRWDGLTSILLYVLIFLGARRFGRLRTAHLYAIGASICLQAVVAALQLLDLNPLALFPDGLRWSDAGTLYSGEFLGTIGNVDLLSAYLSLMLPLLIGAYLLRKKRWHLLIPVFFGVLLLLYAGTAAGPLSLLLGTLLAAPFLIDRRDRLRRFFVLLAVTLVSAALYRLLPMENGKCAVHYSLTFLFLLLSGMLCGVVAYLLYLRRDLRDVDPKIYRRGILLAELLLILTAVVLVYLWPGESGVMYELRCVLHGDVRESFGSSRIRIWLDTLALLPERPLLGGGPGTLALRLEIEFERFVPETGKTLRSFADNAHNVYLGCMADTGVLGLLSYLTLIACTCIESFKKRTAHGYMILYGLISAWIADIFGLGLCLTAPMLWLIWGLSGATGPERPDAPGES